MACFNGCSEVTPFIHLSIHLAIESFGCDVLCGSSVWFTHIDPEQTGFGDTSHVVSILTDNDYGILRRELGFVVWIWEVRLLLHLTLL